MTDFFETVAALRREGQPFAVATVVARHPPVSAHLGDRAIVFADGRMEGFVGGACSREIVRKQALEAMRSRRPCLLSIRPDAATAGASDPEHVIVAMTCVSEGAIDVYVEPFVRARRLVVVGMTPVAERVSRTALSLDYEVVRVVEAREQADLAAVAGPLGITVAPLDSLQTVMKEAGPEAAAVVASQGHYDEEALETILGCGASYVGLVASRKRGASVREFLEERGVRHVDSVRIPAGLDLGARTAPEVALSILAEIVQARPDQSLAPPVGREVPYEVSATPSPDVATETVLPETAVDPVCGMEVETADARHTADVDGTVYYFCCAQCKARFVKEPSRYLEPQP